MYLAYASLQYLLSIYAPNVTHEKKICRWGVLSVQFALCRYAPASLLCNKCNLHKLQHGWKLHWDRHVTWELFKTHSTYVRSFYHSASRQQHYSHADTVQLTKRTERAVLWKRQHERQSTLMRGILPCLWIVQQPVCCTWQQSPYRVWYRTVTGRTPLRHCYHQPRQLWGRPNTTIGGQRKGASVLSSSSVFLLPSAPS